MAGIREGVERMFILIGIAALVVFFFGALIIDSNVE